MGEMIQFTRPDGQSVPGYLVESDRGRTAPAIVLIQEWWGLNPQIKHSADRLAAAGYRVLVPDLYRGKLASSADEASHFMNNLDWAGAVQDIAGATRYLKTDSNKVGVMGFCMGGALTILAAVNVPGVDAAVCFYGVPPESAADPAQIRIPFQGHFADQDYWVTPEVADKLEQKLKDGNVDFEIYRYDAQHAFFNEARPEVYDPEAANEALRRTLEFFGRHLS